MITQTATATSDRSEPDPSPDAVIDRIASIAHRIIRSGESDPIHAIDVATEVVDRGTYEPVGEVEWSEDSYSYVACCYGAEGDSPEDCYTRYGEDVVGQWWIDDGDGDVRGEQRGPYESAAAAKEGAAALASDQNEAELGEDAETMKHRLLTERAGEPDPEGDWAVYWESACVEDERAVERYDSRDSAEAAAELAEIELKREHRGTLLCGYSVRYLDGDRWAQLDEDIE